MKICASSWVAEHLCRLKLLHRAQNARSMQRSRTSPKPPVRVRNYEPAARVPADRDITRESFRTGTSISRITSEGFARDLLSEPESDGDPGTTTEEENTIHISDVESASSWVAEEDSGTVSISVQSQPIFPSTPVEPLPSKSASQPPMPTQEPPAPVSDNPRKRKPSQEPPAPVSDNPRKRMPSRKVQKEMDFALQTQKEKEQERVAKRRKTTELARSKNADIELNTMVRDDITAAGDITDGEATQAAAESQKKRVQRKQQKGKTMVTGVDEDGNVTSVWI